MQLRCTYDARAVQVRCIEGNASCGPNGAVVTLSARPLAHLPLAYRPLARRPASQRCGPQRTVQRRALCWMHATQPRLSRGFHLAACLHCPMPELLVGWPTEMAVRGEGLCGDYGCLAVKGVHVSLRRCAVPPVSLCILGVWAPVRLIVSVWGGGGGHLRGSEGWDLAGPCCVVWVCASSCVGMC